MSKEMCWLSPREGQPKILFIDEGDGFVPYANCVHFVPDYPIGSKGYATMQKLLNMGWKLVT
jgi:hypothetical protein